MTPLQVALEYASTSTANKHDTVISMLQNAQLQGRCGSKAPKFRIILGENRYGKAENRVVRVTRETDQHMMQDLNVSVQLSGDFEETHTLGSNAKVLPTDTQKNTVYAFAQKHSNVRDPELFGLLLCEHFLCTQKHVLRAEVRIEEYLWERIIVKGRPHPRAFRKNSSFKRVARIVVERSPDDRSKLYAFVSTGIEDLVVLKTGDSEFTGFIRDKYTTLPDTTDRIMSTQVSAHWRHDSRDIATLRKKNFARSFSDAVDTLQSVFADHYSLSLQQTLFSIGREIITEQPDICAVRLSLPNKHHFLVDLTQFGQTNRSEVFFAADRPYGLIEAVVERDDAPDPGFIWPAW
jgi:urate oxidase